MTTDPQEEPRTTYGKYKLALTKSYLGWLETPAKLGFFGLLIAKRDLTADVLGLTSSAVWRVILILFVLHLFGSTAMSVSSVICHKHTGIVYAENRVAFALAGGFDVGRLPILIAQVGTFGVLWQTSKLSSDPLAFARGPWLGPLSFTLVSTLIGLIVTAVVAEIVFRHYAEHHPDVLFAHLARRLRA